MVWSEKARAAAAAARKKKKARVAKKAVAAKALWESRKSANPPSASKGKAPKAAKGYTISRGTNSGKTANRVGKKRSRG